MEEAVSPELIAATESVLESHGWTGLTADQIAEAAGINRVTLYRRGLSTATLLTATATAAVVEFRSLAAKALLQPGTASQRLDQLLKALYELADRHLALLAGLFDGPTAMFHLSRTRGDASAITRFEYTEPFERLLRDGITDGTLRSTNPREDAELIFNTAGWVYVHLRRSHGWSARRARPAVTRVSAAFVRHPVASASASP